MKIKRTINGQEYEFELTRKELSQALYEETENDLRKEADYAFDHYLVSEEKPDFSTDKPRVNEEAGIIPGSAAYRSAWREVFLDSHSMWEDHGSSTCRDEPVGLQKPCLISPSDEAPASELRYRRIYRHSGVSFQPRTLRYAVKQW